MSLGPSPLSGQAGSSKSSGVPSRPMFGDPAFSELHPGHIFDMVVQTFSVHDGLFSARALWHDEQIWLQSDIQEAPAIWTLYGVQYKGVHLSRPLLCCLETTQVFRNPEISASSFSNLAEICAGVGGISMGMQEVGGRVLAFVDKCPLACRVLRQKDLRSLKATSWNAKPGLRCISACKVSPACWPQASHAKGTHARVGV